MRRIHDTNLVFVHIPKTAGMSITSAFGLEHDTKDHSISVNDKLLSDKYIRFAVLRDPIDRFISAYNYNKNKPVGNFNNPSTRLRQIINQCSNIDTFITYVKSKNLPINDPKEKILHFANQSYWYDNGKPSIILDFQNISHEMPDLLTSHALP